MKVFQDCGPFLAGIRGFRARIRSPREILHRIALISAFFDLCEAISDHFSVCLPGVPPGVPPGETFAGGVHSPPSGNSTVFRRPCFDYHGRGPPRGGTYIINHPYLWACWDLWGISCGLARICGGSLAGLRGVLAGTGCRLRLAPETEK